MRSGKRATIVEIAAEAGVSVASVSYALNGKPGVSEQTRRHILEIAARRDWAPSPRARNLSRSAADVIGLVIPASVDLLRDETFWMLFVSGLEAELREGQNSLLLHVEERQEEEIEIYRSWHRRGVVDLVVVLDLQPGDARVKALEELGMSFVLGGRLDRDVQASCAYTADTDEMRLLLGALAADGCRRFARIAGDSSMVFVKERSEAFDAFLAEQGLENLGTRYDSFQGTASAELSTGLLDAPEGPPDVIVYDSDLLAVNGLRGLLAAGHRVPEDVQIAAFDDSALCRLVTPSITALSRDAHEFGRLVGRLAVSEAAGGLGEPQMIPALPGTLQRRETTRAR